MKKVTRLTESELHAIISESVNRILNECGMSKKKTAKKSEKSMKKENNKTLKKY